jgi:hypothetical protein
MRPLGLALLLSWLAASACASRQRFEDLEGPEGLVEVLPRAAQLEVDGVPMGPGGRTLPVRDPGRVHRLRATAEGFEPAEVAVEGAALAGTRVGLVLRPAGFGAARALSMDEPGGLHAAASSLLRAGRAREAIEYSTRAAELTPRSAPPFRILADAWLALGARDRAARSYAAWLERAPEDAPGRADVERRLSELRGDLDLGPAR